MQVKTLTDFLKEEYYALQPLYNFYFTRDTSVVIGNRSLVCKMANAVRMRESFIMDAIFNSGLFFNTQVSNMYDLSHNNDPVTIEGGDVLVARCLLYTSLEADIDKYDLMKNPYHQLIVWDPEKEEILGGYRFIMGKQVDFDEKGKPMLATAHLLNFSDDFLKNYLPYTVELGRSFVSLEYQSTLHSRKGIFALDNLWDGLGALTVKMCIRDSSQTEPG